MIVGVTGDTHNNLKNIKSICGIFNEYAADIEFHTGDISLAKSLLAFSELNCPMKVVLGNNDIQEKESLEEVSKRFDCEIFEEPFSIKLSSKKITILHDPDLINEKMISENNIILHGHTHRFRLEKKGDCIIFNPGECAGFMENKNQVGIIDLKNPAPKIVNFWTY